MHVDGDVLPDDFLDERNESFADIAQDHTRVRGRRIDRGKLADEVRHVDRRSAAHGLGKKGLLGIEMAEDSGGRDLEPERDVSQSRGLEALRGEDATCRCQQLLARDSRRSSHR